MSVQPNNPLVNFETRYNNNSNTASFPSTSGISQSTPNHQNANATTVINLSNSSEVVIGPMNQYSGPVTIYQYMDATVDPSRAGPNMPNIPQQRNCMLFGYIVPNWLIVIVLLITTSALSFGIFELLQNKKNSSQESRVPRETLFGDNFEDPMLDNLGNGHFLINRKQWGAAAVTNLTKKLQHPVTYVMITHVGVQSDPCTDFYKCSVKMRSIQDGAVAEKRIPDLPANFYVGGNGFVFEGRGWDFVNTYNSISLAIGFMGDFIRFFPTEKQMEAVQFLINNGIARKYIRSDYKLIAHNQTRKTSSPGVNVYNEIFKWPHWYQCDYKSTIKCGAELGDHVNMFEAN